MARTTSIKKLSYREIEYNGCKIRKYEIGRMFIIEPDGNEVEVEDKEEAMLLIDDGYNKPKKSKRTTGKKVIELKVFGPSAGFMGNVPITCKYKVMDEKKIFYTDVLLCQKCGDLNCPAYIELFRFHPDRKKYKTPTEVEE